MNRTDTNMLKGCETFLKNIHVDDYEKSQLSKDLYVYYFTYTLFSKVDSITFVISIYVNVNARTCKMILTNGSWPENPINNLLDREMFNNSGITESIYGKTSLGMMESCTTCKKNQLYYTFNYSNIRSEKIDTQLFLVFDDLVHIGFNYHVLQTSRSALGFNENETEESSDFNSGMDTVVSDSKKYVN